MRKRQKGGDPNGIRIREQRFFRDLLFSRKWHIYNVLRNCMLRREFLKRSCLPSPAHIKIDAPWHVRHSFLPPKRFELNRQKARPSYTRGAHLPTHRASSEFENPVGEDAQCDHRRDRFE
jgi:hypothetical protein